MERKIKQEVEISEVIFDEEVYPRSSFQWQTSYDYAQSMLTGAKFPPITLAVIGRLKVLVDGKHRLEALKQLKETKVDAEIFTGWSKKKVFEEAVKRNISHGRVLSPFEKRRIALKFREMDYTDSKICEIIQVPQDKLENFVAQRLINAITGEEILKSEIKHLAGTSTEEDIEKTQETLRGKSQLILLREIVHLLENNLMDTENKNVAKLLLRLKELLN